MGAAFALAMGEHAHPGGRETPALRCYAQRYPDLLSGFCSGSVLKCDWGRLNEHWQSNGQAEGRTFGCAAAHDDGPKASTGQLRLRIRQWEAGALVDVTFAAPVETEPLSDAAFLVGAAAGRRHATASWRYRTRCTASSSPCAPPTQLALLRIDCRPPTDDAAEAAAAAAEGEGARGARRGRCGRPLQQSRCSG